MVKNNKIILCSKINLNRIVIVLTILFQIFGLFYSTVEINMYIYVHHHGFPFPSILIYEQSLKSCANISLNPPNITITFYLILNFILSWVIIRITIIIIYTLIKLYKKITRT